MQPMQRPSDKIVKLVKEERIINLSEVEHLVNVEDLLEAHARYKMNLHIATLDVVAQLLLSVPCKNSKKSGFVFQLLLYPNRVVGNKYLEELNKDRIILNINPELTPFISIKTPVVKDIYKKYVRKLNRINTTYIYEILEATPRGNQYQLLEDLSIYLYAVRGAGIREIVKLNPALIDVFKKTQRLYKLEPNSICELLVYDYHLLVPLMPFAHSKLEPVHWKGLASSSKPIAEYASYVGTDLEDLAFHNLFPEFCTSSVENFKQISEDILMGQADTGSQSEEEE